MRDRFSELIEKGVAIFQEKPLGTPTPCLDPMVKLYNNVWGVLTDTHMSKVGDDEYVITGSFLRTPGWERFKYCSNWGSTNFRLASGYWCLDSMVCNFGYKMSPDTYNSDYVIKLSKREDGEMGGDPGGLVPCDDQCVGCPCSNTCMDIVTTSESQIPRHLREFFTPSQCTAIKEIWENAGGDANKIVEGFMGCYELKRVGCRISSDSEYLVINESLKIKLQ